MSTHGPKMMIIYGNADPHIRFEGSSEISRPTRCSLNFTLHSLHFLLINRYVLSPLIISPYSWLTARHVGLLVQVSAITAINSFGNGVGYAAVTVHLFVCACKIARKVVDGSG